MPFEAAAVAKNQGLDEKNPAIGATQTRRSGQGSVRPKVLASAWVATHVASYETKLGCGPFTENVMIEHATCSYAIIAMISLVLPGVITCNRNGNRIAGISYV